MNELSSFDTLKLKIATLFFLAEKQFFSILSKIALFVIFVFIFYLNYKFYAQILLNTTLEGLVIVMSFNLFSLVFMWFLVKVYKDLKKLADITALTNEELVKWRDLNSQELQEIRERD